MIFKKLYAVALLVFAAALLCFDILAVFVKGGGTYAVKLASCKHGL